MSFSGLSKCVFASKDSWGSTDTSCDWWYGLCCHHTAEQQNRKQGRQSRYRLASKQIPAFSNTNLSEKAQGLAWGGEGQRSWLLKPLVYLKGWVKVCRASSWSGRKEQRLEAAGFPPSTGHGAPRDTALSPGLHATGSMPRAPCHGRSVAPIGVLFYQREKWEELWKISVFPPENKQCLSLRNPKDKLTFYCKISNTFFVKDQQSERPNFWQACHFHEVKDRKISKHQQTEEQFSWITCWETELRNYPRMTITHRSPVGQVHSPAVTLNFEKQMFVLHGVISWWNYYLVLDSIFSFSLTISLSTKGEKHLQIKYMYFFT